VDAERRGEPDRDCWTGVVVVVAAAAVWLRPMALHSVVRMLRPVRAVVIHAVEPRAPSLAELCLLRT
jgi:hypothetical protein